MSNEGFLKFVRNNTEKDLVTVIQEETADNLTQSEADTLYLGKTEKASSASTADAVAWNNITGKPSIPSTPNAYVNASWRSGDNWYVKFSNGLIMQGGHFNGRANGVSLHVAFTTANYAAFWVIPTPSSASISARVQTTTYLGSSSIVSTARDVIWFAVGY